MRALRTLLATLSTRALPEVDDDAAEVDRWRAGLSLSGVDDAALLAGLKSFQPLFRRLFSQHIQVSFKAGVSGSVLHQLCEKFLNDPSLATVLVSGLGGVESAGPSVALWRLARTVAGDPQLAAMFDAGLDGAEERLRADPHAAAFVEKFDRFLTDFGYRGPNEWDFNSPTWDVNPGGAIAAIDALRHADASHDPDAQRARLEAESATAFGVALERLPRRVRGRFKNAVRSAQVCSRARERTKSTAIGAIHGVRLIARELGTRAEARGASDAAMVLLVTADELSGYLADPAAWNDRLAARRRRGEELARLEPPFVLTPDRMSTATWPARSDTALAVTAGEVLTGIGACPGVARGRARVVLDPYDPRGLGPGDVLVAPITDPSWTPLFLSAEAVVVDVGAVMSHAVIVSRELGIPAVVSVTNATRRIPDGALIEVDGLEVCERLREQRPSLPVILLTARAEEVDLVVGLDAGADDYVTKPFKLAELTARIRARLRPAAVEVADGVAASGEVTGVRIDKVAHRAWHGAEELELSVKEFDLLALLVEEAGRVVPRTEIMSRVWNEHWYGPTRTLDMHISWLRRKLGDDPSGPTMITTVRGVGFRFELDQG